MRSQTLEGGLPCPINTRAVCGNTCNRTNGPVMAASPEGPAFLHSRAYPLRIRDGVALRSGPSACGSSLEQSKANRHRGGSQRGRADFGECELWDKPSGQGAHSQQASKTPSRQPEQQRGPLLGGAHYLNVVGM